LALLAGSLPFVVLGLAIAYWASPKSALPAANLLYMLLAYAGGLWTGPGDLPRMIRALSPYTPTRQWGDVLWAAVAGAPWRTSHWLLLAAYAAGFGALATSCSAFASTRCAAAARSRPASPDGGSPGYRHAAPLTPLARGCPLPARRARAVA